MGPLTGEVASLVALVTYDTAKHNRKILGSNITIEGRLIESLIAGWLFVVANISFVPKPPIIKSIHSTIHENQSNDHSYASLFAPPTSFFALCCSHSSLSTGPRFIIPRSTWHRDWIQILRHMRARQVYVVPKS